MDGQAGSGRKGRVVDVWVGFRAGLPCCKWQVGLPPLSVDGVCRAASWTHLVCHMLWGSLSQAGEEAHYQGCHLSEGLGVHQAIQGADMDALLTELVQAVDHFGQAQHLRVGGHRRPWRRGHATPGSARGP